MEFFHLYFDDYMLQKYNKDKQENDQQKQEEENEKELKERSKPRILDNKKIHTLKPEKRDGVVVFVGLLFIGLVIGYIGYQQLGTKDSFINMFNSDATVKSLPGINEQAFSDAVLEYNNEQVLSPLAYYLDLKPSIALRTYSSSLVITVKCNQATSVIKLNSVQHQIKEFRVRSFDVDEMDVTATAIDQRGGVLVAELAQSLIRDHQYNFTMKFVGNVTESSQGMLLRQYQEGNSDKRQLLTGMLGKGQAKYVLPCVQQTQKKVDFQLTLTHASSLTALSSMPLEKTVSEKDGSVKTIFKKTSTSLDQVSFILAEYESRTFTTLKGRKFRLFAPKGRLNETNGLDKVIDKIVQYYGVLFGMPYSLQMLDFVPIPALLQSASITPRLSLIQEEKFLLNPDTKTLEQMEDQILSVAKALVKQLFGCLKNADLSVNSRFIESFSLYLSHQAANYVYPSWKFLEKFYDEVVEKALTLDGDGRMQYSNGNVLKGAAVLQMMAQYVGESKFHESIMLTCNKQAAFGENLIYFVFKRLPSIYIQRLKYWFYTDNFPLISMAKGYRGNKYLFSQEPFLKPKPGASLSNWPVPILVKGVCKNSQTKKFVLTIKKGQVTLDQCYLHKVNVRGEGYYRAQYTNSDGRKIVRLLNTSHKALSSRDRANLINDAFQIARSNSSSLISALNITTYLNKEQDYIPFKAALMQMRGIADLFDSASTTQWYFQKYIQQKVQPVLDALKNLKKPSHTQKKLSGLLTQQVMMSRKYLSTEMDNYFLRFALSQFKQQPPAYLRQDAFEAGMLRGGAIEWNLLFNYMKSTPTLADKIVAVDALSVTKNINLLERLKEYTNLCDPSSLACAQNKLFTWEKICSNQAGSEMIKAAFVKEWKTFANSPPELNEALESFMFNCLGSGKTDADMKQVESMKVSSSMTPFQTILSEVMDRIARTMRLRHQKDNVKSWLLASLK